MCLKSGVTSCLGLHAHSETMFGYQALYIVIHCVVLCVHV
jgi:hypothetical protein